MAFQYLKGAYKKHGHRFFSRAHCHGLKMKEGTFRLHAREKFFGMRVVKRWDKLPIEVIDASSLESV